jgi:hypothetical protein
MRCKIVLIIAALVSLHVCSSAQPFVHPGMDQTAKDLGYMKSRVLKGEEPWKSAFDRLKALADTSSFTPQPHTHVLRGPYGKPNIGGNELSRNANMAYNYALAWYITNDKKYAEKAIATLKMPGRRCYGTLITMMPSYWRHGQVMCFAMLRKYYVIPMQAGSKKILSVFRIC